MKSDQFVVLDVHDDTIIPVTADVIEVCIVDAGSESAS